jgi:hypothetical protein
MEQPAAVNPGWHTSSYSSNGGVQCVEAGRVPGAVLVRDTTQHGRGACSGCPRPLVAPHVSNPRRRGHRLAVSARAATPASRVGSTAFARHTGHNAASPGPIPEHRIPNMMQIPQFCAERARSWPQQPAGLAFLMVASTSRGNIVRCSPPSGLRIL